MNCRGAKKVVRSILTETATAQETATFQKHLMDCARCSSLYDGLAETAALLGRLPSPVLSAEFDDRFARRLRAATMSSARAGHIGIRMITSIWRPDWLWAFAAVAAAIFFSVIQAQIPNEAVEPLSFSRINALSMITIMMIASAIIRKALESDFRLPGVFRRAK